MEKYNEYKVIVKSSEGVIWSTIVNTVNIKEACDMVEDTQLDGGEIVQVSKVQKQG